MEFEKFKQVFDQKAKQINLEINEEKCKKLYNYMNILLEWNEKMNLTAITKPEDIIVKHFIDSLTIIKYINEGASIIDIGTGAGFPGIPLAIVLDTKVTLVDSLNKRVNFLKVVVEQLNLKNVEVVCSRAEELGQNVNYREQYDFAVSRAVAPMNVLVEYLIPFVKQNGRAIFMKGPNIEEESKNLKNIVKVLGGKYISTTEVLLENEKITRNIVIVEKKEKTNKKYPRRIGVPSKEPLK